ncbi:MAG: phosphoribosylanthranilate isomerase [Sulfuricurvum sp.]|nr:phosphoribosylanthranilate isomerase [Sulfuricurvum sp.]
MRVKICGITNIDDAIQAVNAGADALGFIFYPESPRYITPQDAQTIIAKLPPFQIHFDVSDDFYTSLHFPSLKVIRAKNREGVLCHADEYRLIDAYCESYGGSGKRLNIEWFKNIDCSKIILAGGLDPENIPSIKEYGFYGVDVSSGVELSHGKKDHQKVFDFITWAKL